MNKQIVVIGLGRMGESLASTLSNIGHEVMALDSDEALVQKVSPEITKAVQVDPTNELALRELGVGDFEIGIVTIPVIETSVLSTILLKKLGVRYVIARAINDLHESILVKIGADKVFNPEREMGTGIAYVLTLGDVIDYIPVTSGYGVVKVAVPPEFVGKTLSDLGFGHRGAQEALVLLLQRKNEIMISPGTPEEIKPGDVLVVSGSWDKLEGLFSRVKETPTEECKER
jgi:trk system potassium uptake protein TrkA